MHINNGFGWTFDTVVEKYDKFRPGYPDELYSTVFDYIPVDASSRAAEVGIGAGQATLPVLKTGCSVTAIEPGEKFAVKCGEKFADYPGFSIITGKFEDIDLPENNFDLVYSATAFHWVPEEIGYRKVFSMLKSGGAFARFANHPHRDREKPELSNAIDELYIRYYCTYHKREHKPPVEYTAQDAEQLARIAEKYGFTDVRHAMIYRTRSFTAKEYTQLLGTYSDHIAIEESIRNAFFGEIENAIDRFGGTITIYDTIDLQLARKP